jgi:uncharacterized membrane protein
MGADPLGNPLSDAGFVAMTLPTLFAIARVFILWAALSVAAFPIFRWCGLRGFSAWLVARCFSPFLFALLCFHGVRWLPFGWSTGVFWIVFAAVALLARCIYRKQRSPRPIEKRAILRFEGILLLLGIALIVVFGYHYGQRALGERPLDLGFVSRSMTTDRIPPLDFWLAGESLNIYYFGSWTIAVMGKGAFLDPQQAYFIGLILIWLSATAACVFASRAMGLRRSAAASIPLMVLALGNGSWLYHRWGGEQPPPGSTFLIQQLARVIPNTINENPSVAFWVSELHAHVFALPLFVLWASLAPWAMRKKAIRLAGLCGLAAGCLAITDSWLVPPAMLVALGLVFVSGKRHLPSTVMGYLFMGAAALVAGLAFLADYHSFPMQVRVLAESDTTMWQILALFGPLLAVGGLVLWDNRSLLRLNHTGTVFTVSALLLAVFCEVFYLESNLPSPAERQNTVFRFHYAAWILGALAIGAFWPKRFRSPWCRAGTWAMIALFVFLERPREFEHDFPRIAMGPRRASRARSGPQRPHRSRSMAI